MEMGVVGKMSNHNHNISLLVLKDQTTIKFSIVSDVSSLKEIEKLQNDITALSKTHSSKSDLTTEHNIPPPPPPLPPNWNKHTVQI